MAYIKIIIVLALLISPQIEAAKIYQWIDESGQVQYSDNKPESKPYRIRSDKNLPHLHGTPAPKVTPRSKSRSPKAALIQNTRRPVRVREGSGMCPFYRKQLRANKQEISTARSGTPKERLRQKRRRIKESYYKECR